MASWEERRNRASFGFPYWLFVKSTFGDPKARKIESAKRIERLLPEKSDSTTLTLAYRQAVS